jgi:hypothetical protein
MRKSNSATLTTNKYADFLLFIYIFLIKISINKKTEETRSNKMSLETNDHCSILKLAGMKDEAYVEP